ncbi:rhamnan synthesis F family protein [Pseudoclavibacter helvolus]|uniref:Rhamnosyltransferase n=1 Tax=Pseudoclavibacter helvolus TaxID=255205 RepID=A0A7W4UMZ6_9MICO|nr:rhamnosyltransferase [Pseudoclavibacter helvolus]
MKLSDLRSPRRLGIFFFFDEEGVVDEYVTTLLDGMQRHFDKLIVVVNGELDEAGAELFRSRPETDLIVRENEGFDSWAYKTGIDSIGWAGLAEFDEFVMFNFTIVGPVADLKLMFDTMDSRDLDFWGITVHHAAPFDPFGSLETPTLPIHLQSHFIAVRRSMFLSEPFQQYWDELPAIPDYAHAVAKHEAKFTWFFERLGFTWAPYVDTSDLESDTLYPLNTYALELVRDRNCPIFKRKTLFAGVPSIIEESSSLNARRLLDYLETSGRFDMRQLRTHMNRSMNQYMVSTTLHDWEMTTGAQPEVERYAALVPLGERFSERLQQALAFTDAQVYVCGPRTRLGEARGHFVDEPVHALEAQHHWTEAMPHIAEGVTLVLGPDNFHTPYYAAALRDARALVESAFDLPTPNDAIDAFRRTPELGMLVAPPVLHSEYFQELGLEWRDTTSDFETLADALGITAPFSRSTPTVQGPGGISIVRTEALHQFGALVAAAPYGTFRKLSQDDWQKLVALAVQSSGFTPRIVVTPRLAKYLLSLSMTLLRTISDAAGQAEGATAMSLVKRMRALR